VKRQPADSRGTELERLWRRHCPTGPAETGPLLVVGADGVRIDGADGQAYLDFAGGATRPLGWRHPALVELPGLPVSTGQTTVWPEAVEFAAILAEVAPGGTNRRVLLCQSGREALARGIDLARTATSRSGVLYLSDCRDFKPGLVKAAAAVVVHPFDTRLEDARTAAEHYGAWLIDDETTVAPGTTGRMLAVEHSGVRPDIYVLGSGAAAGLPLGACITSGSTRYWSSTAAGPSPAACAAGSRYFALLKSGLIERGMGIGRRFERTARIGPDGSPGQWFGIGAHWDLVFGPSGPDATTVASACRDRGLLVGAAGKRAVAVRPALTTTDKEVEQALSIVADAVRAIKGGRRG
jgi:4-aminobutyrate aminotransferase-like enzyme